MISIIISPKFNKENLLSIHLENKNKKIFKNIKLCFSLVYSIQSLEGATIARQVGRYYELQLNPEPSLSNKKKIINIQLQKSQTGTYNLSCGPEGIFILDNNNNLIESELKKLKFDQPIIKKIYEKINIKIINPIIPEPLKINLSNNFLKNSDKTFFSKNEELQKIFNSLELTSNTLGINFNKDTGVEIKSNKVEMQKDAYRIMINSKNIEIYSNDYGGSFYAVISILQLADYYFGDLPIGNIEDRPRFSWRGMHLDCARQFHTIDQIKRLLIYMSIFKLNRFHWHLTDNEAWRLDLENFPNLAKKTSFRGFKETIPPFYGSGYLKNGGYYSKHDVRELIIFAKNLNIEIMPEIDLPAHSWALLQVMPELYDHSSRIESRDVGNYKNNTINPALPSVWKFLEKTIQELGDLFSYDVVHMGLDERPKSAWEGSEKITEMMKEKNLLNYKEVQDFYISKIINLLKAKNKITAAWNEAVISPHIDIGSAGGTGNIDKSCLIFAWEHPDVALQAVKKGFKTVLCPGQKTYFDMAHNNSTEERGICWAATIEVAEVHSWNPLQNIDNKYQHLILGIQGQLWSETLTEKSFIDQMINPRLATLAEVAWSSEKRRGWKNFRLSLKNSVKLLNKIGWDCHDF